MLGALLAPSSANNALQRTPKSVTVFAIAKSRAPFGRALSLALCVKIITTILYNQLLSFNRDCIMKDGFELRKSSGKGEGIYATQSFTMGDIVMVGVIKEMLNGNHSHASQVGENKFVLHDGLITKVNHACDPNCGIRVNETGGHNFVAITKISVNEEITFDYAMRNYRIDYFPKACMCGSKTCRGRITG